MSKQKELERLRSAIAKYSWTSTVLSYAGKGFNPIMFLSLSKDTW
ncbi:hypothetical protein [Scytonema hofmannii]|nr:hypothetical protein [Scytonema hofmannii]